jgi:ubiquinol-cytochrome c reductase cytochrome c subunit
MDRSGPDQPKDQSSLTDDALGRRDGQLIDLDGLDFDHAVPDTGAELDEQIDARARTAARRTRQRSGTRRGIRAAQERRPRTGRKRRSRLRRRVSSAIVLLAALFAMGTAYSLFASASGANASATSEGDAAAGRQLYEISCITCHGANLDGVPGRGPSLIGSGAAATYFQVATGRMPAAQQGGENDRKPTGFTEEEIRDLVAFVQSIAGGPQLPEGDLRNDADMAEGGELFRLNCASCHSFSGKGAPLSAGKNAPSLNDATDLELYTAMLTGPENMPVFSDNQLTPEQKKAIISYIQTLKASKDPGGHGLDRIGPVSEGLVIWVVGIGVLMGVILWIGAKS